MGAAVLAVTAVSTLVSAFGAYQQGQQAAANAKYQSQVAQNNADIQRANAMEERRAGMAREQAEIYRVRSLIGEQEAQQAASGLDVNVGTLVDVRSSTRYLGNQSIANVRDESGRRAAGFETQAVGFENESANLKTAAANARSGALLNVGGALLGGATKGFGQFGDMKASGVPMWDTNYLIP